eukprot:COSAG05_NODE_23314_length_259_cov_0.531250_1_plen_81_part_01
MLHCERASIFLIDAAKGELGLHTGVGVSSMRLPRHAGIAGSTAIEGGEHITINDAYADARFDPATDKATGFTTHSIMSTPI